MVMAERSCWRSGTDKRGWAVRSGTARGELAVSDTAEPTAEAWAFAGGQTTSIAAGIPTVLRSGCFRGLIAYSFLFIPSLSRSLYATDLFTRSDRRLRGVRGGGQGRAAGLRPQDGEHRRLEGDPTGVAGIVPPGGGAALLPARVAEDPARV